MLKKLLVLLVGTLVMFGLIGFADSTEPIEYYIDDINSSITISGKISDLSYGDPVNVLVVKVNNNETEEQKLIRQAKSLTALKSEGLLKGYIQSISNSNGEYSVKFSIKDAGDYALIVAAPSDKLYEKVIYYSTRAEKTNFIESAAPLFKQASSLSLASKLNLEEGDKSSTARLFAISGDNSVIFSVQNAGLADVFYNLVNNEAKKFTPVKDVETYVKEMTPEIFVQKLALSAKLRTIIEGTKSAIDYKTEFGIGTDYITTYDSKVTADEKSNFSKYSAGKQLYSVEDAVKNFKESVSLSVITSSRGWGDYKYMIETHGSDLGITKLTEYYGLKNRADVTNYLTKNYTTVKDFAEDVDIAIGKVKEAEQNAGGSGLGGGSLGGSGGGGIMNKVPTVTITPGQTAIPAPNQGNLKTFNDLSDVKWAEEAISALYDKGIINGTGGGKFEPNNSVKREEFIKMAVLAAGITEEKEAAGFEDVDSKQWHSGFIAAAVKNNITNGVSETEFGVGREISRQDVATILYRVAKLLNYNAELSDKTFADDASIADYAKDAVYFLKGAEIINGRENNSFCPTETCTRAEVAKMIYGLLEKI